MKNFNELNFFFSLISLSFHVYILKKKVYMHSFNYNVKKNSSLFFFYE